MGRQWQRRRAGRTGGPAGLPALPVVNVLLAPDGGESTIEVSWGQGASLLLTIEMFDVTNLEEPEDTHGPQLYGVGYHEHVFGGQNNTTYRFRFSAPGYQELWVGDVLLTNE